MLHSIALIGSVVEVFVMALKVIAVGDEQGVILPAQVLARLHRQADGTVIAEQASDGLTLLTSDAAHDRQMTVARRLMREREGVLRVLARS